MHITDTSEFRRMIEWWRKQGFASVGFAGSSNGLTPGQTAVLRAIFSAVRDTVGVFQFHHQSRFGGDQEAHYLALDYCAFVVVHPHAANRVSGAVLRRDTTYDARLVGHDTRRPFPALQAAKDIVSEVSLVLVAPALGEEALAVSHWDLAQLARTKPIAVLTLAPEIRMRSSGKF